MLATRRRAFRLLLLTVLAPARHRLPRLLPVAYPVHPRSTTSSSAHQHQDIGLPDLAQIAPVVDVQSANATSHSDLDLCCDFLASSSSPPRETLDSIAQVASAFFSSLPNQRGRFCEALLFLPALDVIADALRLESVVLQAVNSYCGSVAWRLCQISSPSTSTRWWPVSPSRTPWPRSCSSAGPPSTPVCCCSIAPRLSSYSWSTW